MATKSARELAPIRLHSEIKHGLAASASILAIALMAQPAYAQTAPVETTTPGNVVLTDTETTDDTVVVTGSRKLQQDSIILKRENTQIVDGLSADEIGDIPALSIGEALETITGVTSHRENGGATEVSIRGLGPFLSSTVINGRVGTNGSGDRSVNFSQFPSELVNKLSVFKTQDASQIEGGVAGQIQLETIKPLDFGKRRIQAEIKGNINPDQLNIDDSIAGDVGFRLTGSYTDQFELGNGDIGISIGGQISDISQPEAETRQTGPTSNSRPACLITNGLAGFTDPVFGGTFTGFSATPETADQGDDDCDDFNDESDDDGNGTPNADLRGSDTEGFDTAIVDGLRVDGDTPFAFAPSQRSFRQNDTRDERDAIFGAIQWEPSDRLSINVDGQYSIRTQTEQRNDLTFNGGRFNDQGLNIGTGTDTTTFDSLIVGPTGAITFSSAENTIEIGGGDFEREETYIGGGINVSYDVTDRLNVSADYGYSRTDREESNREFRIQSDITPVITFDRTNGTVPQFILSDDVFDVNDPTNFVDRLRIRIDQDVDRENIVNSGRLDVAYDLGEGGFFTDFKAGYRWAAQDFLDLDGGTDSGNPFDASRGRFSFEIENDGEFTVNNQEVIDDQEPDFAEGQALQDALVSIIGSTNEACFEEFQESDFLGSTRPGDLVTNIDDNGEVISSTNSFATFDASCVAETAVGSVNALLGDLNAFLVSGDSELNSSVLGFGSEFAPFSSTPPDLLSESINVIDVRETTQSFYALANYESSIDGTLPISGNVGVRLVRTNVESTGFRPELIVNETADGEFTLALGDLEAVRAENTYTNVLPSANLIAETSENTLVRLGVFRALSRADPADLGFGRVISTNVSDSEDDTVESLEQLINQVTAEGNPEIDPLTSWNFDAAFEWYPNDDTILALGAYAKSFQGGFSNVLQTETFDVNGSPLQRDVSVQQTTDETSQLYGFELTASHAFTYLPGYLSGLGFKVSYNYATSNFETEDSRFGDLFIEDTDGNIVQTNLGIIAPGGLPGLSEHTLSAQGYYEIGDLDLSVRYKYRDDYFQPFTSDGTRLRFVNAVGIWEARASYKLTDNFRLQAEIINALGENREDSAFVIEDVFQTNDFGSRIFFGLRGRF